MTVEDSLVERLKQAAGESAARLVKPGMKLGMGTGSTVYYTIVAVGEAWQRGDLPGLTVVPTSERTATLARKYDLPLVDLSDCPTLDLTIDGADEVDPDLQLIKGLGGALLREKIVAFASRAMVVVVDGKKPTARLGTLAPLPVEVDPFGWRATEVHLGGLGSEPTLRVRDGAPYRTDGGHYIIDCRFADGIPDPRSLQQRLRSIAGVLECGLFVDIAKYVIVAHEDGLRTMGTPPT